MSKIRNSLEKQLSMPKHHQNAEDCIKIYEKLLELCNGSVWSRDWEVLTTCSFIGNFPNCERIYRPTAIGRVFLKGIENCK